MKVLYVNHTAEVSGAERSLLELIAALPRRVRPRLATPEGPLADRAQLLSIPTVSISGTAGSLRLHPLHTARALGEIAAAAAGLRRATREFDPTLVHANSIRAGLALGLSRPQVATVVHVRDCLPPGRLSSATLRLVSATATTVVANSEYTAESVRRAAPKAKVEVVHSPVDLERWDPSGIDRVHARARLPGVRSRALLLGVLAQLTPWKGQDAAIETLHLLRKQGVDAHLLLIGSAKFVAGSTRFDNRAYVDGLKDQVRELRLEDRVSWLGEREDVVELVAALDVLLLPSHEEPFGRAVIEAMALEVPVIATSVGGPAEILTDGREGYLVPPRSPVAWAEAVRLIGDPALRRLMGRAGRQRVEEAFTLGHHVDSMVAVYDRALSATRPR
jgi:glycosyltransferase involved in cell wall biosynthesis